MDAFNSILETIDEYIWGVPLMVLILAGGLLLTIRTGVIQIRKLPLALKWVFQEEADSEETGEISSFGALMTSLSATVGTGNIVGVATAVSTGGPGALFWMVITAFIGMATKYSEGFLAIRFRDTDANGKSLGGPFMYIEKGMGPKWKWLAKVFAFFGASAGLFGIGTITQVNGINNAVNDFFNSENSTPITIPGIGSFSIYTVVSSVVIAVLVGLIIIGGIKRITRVSTFFVPIMFVIYLGMSIGLIICNITEVPKAVAIIVEAAFNPMAVTGGMVGSFFVAVQKGMARGIFSNEAGLGSAPIAAAATKTKQPVRQGLVSMTGTFFDTIIICSMTGICIVLTGAWQIEGIEGVQITTYAFQTGLPIGDSLIAFLIMVCLLSFAFTSIIGWNYYAERCVAYLVPNRPGIIRLFRIIYILTVFIGPYLTVSVVWTIADIFNGLMAIPNMIAIFALSGVIARETRQFFKEKKSK